MSFGAGGSAGVGDAGDGAIYKLYLALSDDIPEEEREEKTKFYQSHIDGWKERQAKQSPNYDAGFDLPFLTQQDLTYRNEYHYFGSAYKLNHQVCAKMVQVVKTSQMLASEVPVSYYLYPRSSISKTPMRMANSVGIIDSGYRGPLISAVDLLAYMGHQGSRTFAVEVGSRYFQVCAPNLGRIHDVILVDSLEETYRGSGGFGSTNVV